MQYIRLFFMMAGIVYLTDYLSNLLFDYHTLKSPNDGIIKTIVLFIMIAILNYFRNKR